MGTNDINAPTPTTLRTWRERMGYTHRQAADAVGCSRGAWVSWESGRHRIPRYIGLACAALALGMVPYGGPQRNLGE